MKQILPIIFCLFLLGCEESPVVKNWMIMDKRYRYDKPCICEYKYKLGVEWITFEDSCNKYSIGDTIK